MSKCLSQKEFTSGSGSGDNAEDEDELQLMWLGIFLGAAGSVGIAIGELGMGQTSEEIAENTPEKERLKPHEKEPPKLHETADYTADKSENETLIAALKVKKFVYRVIFVVSAITNFVAFGFAPNPVLAPLEGLQFVSAFAWSVYYRKPTLFDYNTKRIKKTKFFYALGGTLTSTVAIVGVVLFTPEIDSTFGVDGLLCLWSRPQWVAVASTFSGVVVLMLLVRWASARLSSPPTTMETKEAKTSVSAMLWAAFVPATVGAIGATLAKQLSELLRVALSGGEDGLLEVFGSSPDGKHSYGMIYTLGVATGICFGYWFLELTNGMKRFEETLALPVYQGTYIVLTALLGGIFFDDFVNYTDVQLIGWMASLTLLVVGLAVIVVGADSSPKKPSGSDNKGSSGTPPSQTRSSASVARPVQVPTLFL